jgi:CBS domain-containing protein
MHRLRTVLQHRKLTTAPPGAWVYEAVRLMTERRVGAIPVLDGEDLVGIFSERDLMTRVVVPERNPRATRVAQVMTRNVITGAPGDSVEACLEKMQRAGFRHLPILQDGRVIDMVSMRDLLKDEIQEQQVEIQSLKAYLHHMPAV